MLRERMPKMVSWPLPAAVSLMSSALLLSLVMTGGDGWFSTALGQEKDKAAEEEQDQRKKKREDRGKGEGQQQRPEQQQQRQQDGQRAGQDAQKQRDQAKAAQEAAQKQREQAQKAREDAQRQRDQSQNATQDAQRQQALEKQQRDKAKAAQDATQKQRDQAKSAQDAQKMREQGKAAQDAAQKQREDAAQKKREDTAKDAQQKQFGGRPKAAEDPPKQVPGQPPLSKQPQVGATPGVPAKDANEQQDSRARLEAERLKQEKAGTDRKDDRKDNRDDRKDARDDRKDARDDRKDDRQDRRQDARLERFDDRMKKLEEVKSERRERVEGARTIIEEPGNRTIIRERDRVIIRHDENDRFRRIFRDARTERRRDGTSITSYRRPDGAQIFTVLDDDGRLIRRYRRTPQGREYVIIDNSSFFRPGRPRNEFDVVINLPPPVIRIPRHKYIVDYSEASPDDVYEALSAPPVERLDRAYSLEEIRRNQPLRERMRRIDLDAITFEFGAFEVSNDQYPKLEHIAEGIKRVLQGNPDEVFMIEGHTDAVGSDVDNLTLSDRRAESVALILSQEFEVPPENLTTQGYGEQFLKVPTEEPERLNRRVAMRRITPLMSQSN